MPENTTLPRTSLLTAGVLVIALAAVFLAGLQLAEDDPVAAAGTSEVQGYGIVTAGTGTVTATPDELRFTASATSTRDTTTAALDATTSKVEAVTAAATRAGVAAEDIQTTGLSIRPKYSYSRYGSRVVGQTANQRLTILVRSLDDAGKVIGAVTAAGGNGVNVTGIKLVLSNRDELVDRARTEAVKQARASAEAMAGAAGREVGELEYVQETDAESSRDYDESRLNDGFLSAAAASKAVISPGEQDVDVTVQVRWSVR